MQSMNGGRSGGRRLKDRLARLLRPANALLRSPLQLLHLYLLNHHYRHHDIELLLLRHHRRSPPRIEPFSAALDLLRHLPPEHKKNNKQRCCSSRHARRRHFKNVDKGVRKLSSKSYGFTTSDDDEETDGGDDDTEPFVSSRSLVSSDSSGFYTSTKQLPKNKNRHRQQQQTRRRRLRAASCVDSCSVWDEEVGVRPLVTTAAAEEQMRKGLAVVKRSRDPYGDFRESMVEMIVERQVFGWAELERLLQSYLSLNAPRLHPVILQAFSDIWVVLHGG